jgi:hypothetical protein
MDTFKLGNVTTALLFLLCFVTADFTSQAMSASRTQPNHFYLKRPVKVLFIGNSYTYFNNLPGMLEQLAKSAGMTIETRMVVEGGATLQDHWEEGKALKVIREGSWDYVILQDQSTLGAFIVNGQNRIADPAYFHKYSRLFDREIKKSDAKTVFYLTWAGKNKPEDDQAALNYAYVSIARELKDLIAPVGIVWHNVRRENPNLELYVEDASHPTGAGTYLAACELYALVLRKSPVGLPFQINGNPVDEDGKVDTQKQTSLVNLTASDAKLIQRTAWEVFNKMRRSGGYPSAPRPQAPKIPTLPNGHRPSVKDLEGVWVGRLDFFPVPWPGKMELRLHYDNAEWKAELKIRFEGNAGADRAPEISHFMITETGISFLDAKGLSGAPMKYTAAFTGSALSGVAEVKVEGKPIYAIGSWELKRAR